LADVVHHLLIQKDYFQDVVPDAVVLEHLGYQRDCYQLLELRLVLRLVLVAAALLQE
jgi:hypothetical protein